MNETDLIERDWLNIFARIVVRGECLIWAGSLDRDGYATFYSKLNYALGKGTKARVARWVCERAYDIQREQVPDHICRVRACINPAHLEPVSERINLLRGIGAAAINARKEFCKRGHSLDASAMRSPSRIARGNRDCAKCALITLRLRRARFNNVAHQ